MSLSTVVLNTNTSVGSAIAVDTISSKAYQQIKLVDGTTGGTDGLPGSTADGLLVNLGSNNDVTVSGSITITSVGTATGYLETNPVDRAARDNGKIDIAAFDVALPTGTNSIGQVTANAGTNLNTSALALEAGNLAVCATALDVLDDWDETNRAAVNLIAGQVAITAGAGAVAANTPRVTHASDDPTVTALQIMDDWDNAASDGASVSGDVAHGSADAGEPVKLGAKAETSPKGVTLVTDGQRTNLYADADGLLMAKIGTSGADAISENTVITSGSALASTVFTAVASTFNYVDAITAFRTDAGATLAYIDFRDGTGGAVLWTMPLPPNSGSTLANARPFIKTSANTALAYDVSSALTDVRISVAGYQSKV